MKHECDHIGVAVGDVKLEQCTQPDGITQYWKATTTQVYLFGTEVCCELAGYGTTKEAATEALHKEMTKLSESLF